MAKHTDFWIFFTILSLLSLFMVCWCGPLSVYSGHDYFFHFYRFEASIAALKDGVYPIYIDYKAMDGYGYFTKAFYPDLMLLPFAALAMATSSVLAYNVMIFTFTMLCGLFMYYAVNSIFKSTYAASISAIVYTFSTYHFYDWYNRGALAESISFTFLPLVFLGLYYIIAGDYKKWYILTIGYGLLIYNHLLSSVMTFIVIVILLLISYKSFVKEPKRILYLLLAATVTFFIVVSYLLPMVEQMLSNTFYYSIRENITGQTKQSPIQIFWGIMTGVAYEGETWHMRNACGVGILPLILILLRLFAREKNILRNIADLCLLIGIVLLFMVSSFFPWGKLPLAFIQFPWRFYEFVAFFFAIAGAYYLSVLLVNNRLRAMAVSAVVLFTITTMIIADNNYKFITKVTMTNAPEWYDGVPKPTNNYYLGDFEYLPLKVPSLGFINQRGDSIKYLNTSARITNFVRTERVISLDVETESSDKIELPLVYYKGYKAINSYKEEFPVEESDHGLVEVFVDKSTDITVYYAGTTTQKVSWYISILSVLTLIVYITYSRRNRISA